MITLFFLFLLNPSDTTGIASFYHNKFIGRKTASGERFKQTEMTAASNFYDLGTKLKVTNLENDSSIVVTVNDRMGNKKRVIDLTKEGARKLNFLKKGITKVRLEVLDENIVFLPNCLNFSVFRMGFPL